MDNLVRFAANRRMTSRQAKQRTLSDLSRTRPDEEEIAALHSLLVDDKESDRGAALIAGALVEAGLETCLSCRFVDCGDTARKGLFEGSGAPLSNFAQKIKVGRALGIYGPETEKALNRVKDIRNAFAHALRPLDFLNPTIVSACKGFEPLPLDAGDSTLAPARVRYIGHCLALFRILITDANDEGGKDILVNYP